VTRKLTVFDLARIAGDPLAPALPKLPDPATRVSLRRAVGVGRHHIAAAVDVAVSTVQAAEAGGPSRFSESLAYRRLLAAFAALSETQEVSA
jgi:hypothetical protein